MSKITAYTLGHTDERAVKLVRNMVVKYLPQAFKKLWTHCFVLIVWYCCIDIPVCVKFMSVVFSRSAWIIPDLNWRGVVGSPAQLIQIKNSKVKWITS